MSTSSGSPPCAQPLNLRLVTIYRHEESGWKRVLRHADRIPIA